MRETELLSSRHIKTILYIYDVGGEIYGYIELSKKLHMGPHTMKHVLLTLELTGILDRTVGPNNIHIYRLTEKGRRIAEKLKEVMEILSES